MLICIDSSVIIPGIQSRNSAAARLLDLIGSEFTLVIPRLIALKVTRNLNTPAQVCQFYKMFQGYSFALIVDEPIPKELVLKYTKSGLPDKADAFIGGFAEWMNVQYLISENGRNPNNPRKWTETRTADYADCTDYGRNRDNTHE